MLKSFLFLLKYVRYYLSSQTLHDIHSPFVFSLVTRVLQDRKHQQVFDRIESVRKKLLHEGTVIEVRDFGAGFGGQKFKKRSLRFITRNSSKPKKYGRLLHRLTAFLRPVSMLELGTSVGISAMYQASGMPSARLITLEGCPNTAAIASRNFGEANMQNIRLVVGEFESTLPQVLIKETLPDYIFIDGNHRKEAVLNYFNQCIDRCSMDACLVIDDINWSAGMQEAWQEIKKNPRVSVTIDLFMLGLVFLNPELSKQDFIIRY